MIAYSTSSARRYISLRDYNLQYIVFVCGLSVLDIRLIVVSVKVQKRSVNVC